MGRSLRIGSGWLRHKVLALAVALTALMAIVPPAAAAVPKRVLFIESFSPQFQPDNFVQTRIRSLAGTFEAPLAFFEVSIEQGLVDQPDGPLLDYIHALFQGGSPDLIVTISAPAMRFAARHRDELFPEVPVLFTGADAAMVANVPLGPRDATALFGADIREVVANVRTVVPQASEFLMVAGSAPEERATAAKLRTLLPRMFPDVSFRFTDGLAFDEVARVVAALGPNTIVYYLSFRVDAGGRMFERDRALEAVHALANVPIFSLYEYRLGRGIVGGYTLSDDALAGHAAGVAFSLLRGADPSTLRLPPLVAGSPAYDARELDRFRIDRAKLGPGSRIRFVEEPRWWPYRWHLVAGLVVLLVESQLIVALVMNRRRLAAAREATVALNRRLVGAQDDERRRIARELHDDFAQRLSRLAVDAGQLASAGAERATELRGSILALARDLSRDVTTLAYRLHPVSLQEVGIVEALRAECDAFALREGIEARFAAGAVPAKLPPELATAFYRVAQEALRNVTRHAAARSVEVTVYQDEHKLELAIRDDGRGFDAAAPNRTGPSLGIESMRERLAMLGGTLVVSSAQGSGTEIVATAPVHGGDR
jgi:signal transduction histidine kinase